MISFKEQTDNESIEQYIFICNFSTNMAFNLLRSEFFNQASNYFRKAYPHELSLEALLQLSLLSDDPTVLVLDLYVEGFMYQKIFEDEFDLDWVF